MNKVTIKVVLIEDETGANKIVNKTFRKVKSLNVNDNGWFTIINHKDEKFAYRENVVLEYSTVPVSEKDDAKEDAVEA